MHETSTIECPAHETTEVDDLELYIQEIVDGAPPLTATQIVQLKRVFRP